MRRDMRDEIELARVMNSDTAAVTVLHSRDGSRLTVATLTKTPCGDWRLAGVAPSFPTVVVPTVIAALSKARDGRAV